MSVLNREDALAVLESVVPGLDKKANLPQSDCFVFQNGKVITYNEEIAASIACPISLTGAVKAEPLAQLLRKLSDDTVRIEEKDGQCHVSTKTKKRSGIHMDATVELPVDSIDHPAEDAWKELPEDFGDAVGIVQNCAGKDESHFVLTCIHLAPTYMEACDNLQVTRYPINIGLTESKLVRKDSLKHVGQLGVTEIADTENWLHFRNSTGLVISCRQYAEDFPSMEDILAAEGTRTVLPGGIAEACDKAGVFTSGPDSRVQVTLRENKLRLRGEGDAGWYEEQATVKYDGPELVFVIDPKLLVELVKRTTECQISEGRLAIDGGSFRYVACLGTTE